VKAPIGSSTNHHTALVTSTSTLISGSGPPGLRHVLTNRSVIAAMPAQGSAWERKRSVASTGPALRTAAGTSQSSPISVPETTTKTNGSRLVHQRRRLSAVPSWHPER
jgi:hypothetical protein